MDTLLSMKVFCQVVESGSFTAAAAALDMSVAMVSKHVQHLEQRLGTRLLHRTSRHVSLNDPGALYYERCRDALNQLDEAENALGLAQQAPHGTLRITAPSWFANRFFARVLHGYRERYPQVAVDISLSDAFVDLVDDGLDLALRIAQGKPPGPQSRALARMEFALVASHAYLQAHGRPRTEADLQRHQMLVYAYAPPGTFRPPELGWRLNNTTLIGQLAAQGAGIAILPRVLIDQESYCDELEELALEGLELPSPTLYAVTHGRRHLSVRVRTFLDHLEASLFRLSSTPPATLEP